MKKLTIITVCLNIASTIERTCQSIVNQTFQDFEWIVVDGASTDDTLQILEKYRNRIDILISEPDKGIYNAMNKGIKLASGEYVNFMNGGDEFYGNDVLAKVFNGKEYDADVIYGDIILKDKYFIYELHRNHRNICKKSLYKSSIYHPATFTKNVILKQNNFNEQYKIAADYDFFLKLYLKLNCKFKRLDTIIAIFFTDGISCTTPKITKQESDQLRKKYFCFIQRIIFNPQNIKNYQFYKMAITHPRYIAGWIKRKLIK